MRLLEELDKVNADIKSAQRRKDAIEAAIKQLDQDGPAAKLAVTLYEKFHRRFDRDGEWHYEITDGIHHWDRIFHRSMLRQAENLLKYVDATPVTAANIEHFLVSHF